MMILGTRDLDGAWTAAESGLPDPRLDRLRSAEHPAGAERVLRALVRLDEGDAAGALEDFDAVLARQPENPVARAHRGLALFGCGRHREAAAVLGAKPLFPQHAFLRRFLWTFWPLHFSQPAMLAGMLSRVPEEFEHAAESRALLDGVDATARGKLAHRLHKAGQKHFLAERLPEAYALIARAWELNPGDETVASSRAWCLLHTGQGAAAEEVIAPRIERGLAGGLPDQGWAAMWAWALHDQGRHREALEVLATLVPEGPEDRGAYLLSALAWKLAGDDKRADRCLAVAFERYFLDSWDFFIHPFHARVVEWLGGLGDGSLPAA